MDDFPKGKRRYMRVRKRRQRVRSMLLQGITNQVEIAASLGCSQPTIHYDIKAIIEGWMKYDRQVTTAMRAVRVKQLEGAAQKAMTSYERSRQDAEEVQTVRESRRCRDCKGKGKIEGAGQCGRCEGKGEVIVEVVTRKVKGQAGDSSFLREFRECIKECARLEGLLLTPAKQVVKINQGGEVHIHGPRIDWSKVPGETLLNLKRAYAQAALEASDANKLMLDVASEEVKEKEGEGERP